MLAIARAMAVSCAWMRYVRAARSDTPDSSTPSEHIYNRAASSSATGTVTSASAVDTAMLAVTSSCATS